jgi:hypothetical protein
MALDDSATPSGAASACSSRVKILPTVILDTLAGLTPHHLRGVHKDREDVVLAYLRIITVGLLAVLAVSAATVAPAIAHPFPIDWGDG